MAMSGFLISQQSKIVAGFNRPQDQIRFETLRLPPFGETGLSQIII